MTKPHEVVSLWRDIDRWFDDHHATHNLEERRRGATPARLAALEHRLGRTLPADLRASLAIHDGGGSFESYELFGTREIAARWTRWTRRHEKGEIDQRWWRPTRIPFAEDSAGNLRCVDPARRRLVAIEVQDRQGVFATPRRGFVDWLRAYRDRLAAGELVVDEDGFVGEPTAPRARHPDELPAALAAQVGNAIINRELRTLRRLLDDGSIRATSRLGFGVPILTEAARHGTPVMVALLIDRGADPNVDAGRSDRNPLIAACMGPRQREKIVELLLDRGADPDTREGYLGTALQVAALYDSIAVVELLLARGADPRAKNRNGETALEALRPDQTKLRALLSAGGARPASSRSSA